jgi:hypothetical protein
MSTENLEQQPVAPAPEGEQQQQQEQQPQNQQQQEESPDELQARSQGWVSKEEWTGDPDKWKPAKEFNERGELFGKIDSMGKELKETKKALKMLQEHHTKVKEIEYNRAVQELKQLQKKHLEEGNSDGYLETTELLTDLKAEQKAREVAAEIAPNQPDPRFLEWVDKNKWYSQNAEMRQYADAVGLGYAQSNPGLEPEDVLKYVAEQVRGRFRERFVNPNRQKPSTVEGSNTGQPRKESFELTDDEKRVMHTFVRAGVLSKEQYIDEVKRLRGVK